MRIYLPILLICVSSISYAQNNYRQAATYNVGTNLLFGGIGAIINKQPNEKVGKAFLRGAWQGAVGGYLVFESKRLIYKYGESGKYSYAWTSKIVNATGNSMIQNGASNNPFGREWYINFGFNHITINTEEKPKIGYQIMPFSLAYGTLYPLLEYKFDFKNTLRTGQFIFEADKIKSNLAGTGDVNGLAITNSILLEDYYSALIAHEIIHTYQYEDLAKINVLFKKPKRDWLNNDNKVVKLYRKWIYTDLNAFVNASLASLLLSEENECHYNSPKEQEANFYSYRYQCR